MEKLRDFYYDKHMSEQVYQFFMQNLNEKALSDVYSGKDTDGYKKAKEAIENAFNELNRKYAEKKKTDSKR